MITGLDYQLWIFFGLSVMKNPQKFDTHPMKPFLHGPIVC